MDESPSGEEFFVPVPEANPSWVFEGWTSFRLVLFDVFVGSTRHHVNSVFDKHPAVGKLLAQVLDSMDGGSRFEGLMRHYYFRRSSVRNAGFEDRKSRANVVLKTVSSKCAAQKTYPAGVTYCTSDSYKSVRQECPTRMSYKSVP